MEAAVKEYIKKYEIALNGMLSGSFKWRLYDTILFKKLRFRVNFDFDFNAAASFGLLKMVKINAGTFPILQALAINVSRVDSIWRDIEPGSYDQSLTVEKITHIVNASDSGIDEYYLEEPYIDSLLDFTNQTPRDGLAYFIFKLCLYFILFHECGHLICGHAPMLNLREILEINPKKKNLEESQTQNGFLNRQWAELEADSCGALMLVEALKIHYLPYDENHASIENDRYMTVRALLFSIGLIFLLFFKRSATEEKLPTTHPHPGLRMAHTFESIATYLSDVHSFEMDGGTGLTEILKTVMLDLHTLGRLLDVDIVGFSASDINSFEKQIRCIQDSVGEGWLKRSSQLATKAVTRLQNSMSFF